MKQGRNTKIALISSVLTILLCFAMFLGTTFAWLTMEVSSGSNVVQAGNLDIELEYALQPPPTTGGNVSASDLVWRSVENNEVALFGGDDTWEPGYTGIVYFRVSNAGKLAMKYRYTLEVTENKLGTKSVNGDIDLTKYIELEVVEDSNNLPFATRAAAARLFGESHKTIYDILNPSNEGSSENYNDKGTVYTSASDGKLGTAETDQVSEPIAVVVHMPSTVGNVANAKDADSVPSIKLKMTVSAAQVEAELDSFSNNYDENAPYAQTTEPLTINESSES